MKTLAHLRATLACQFSDISPPSSLKIPARSKLAGWAGLCVLLLVPITILATPGESQAGSCCKGRYRSASYSGHRHTGSYIGGLALGSEGPGVAAVQQRLTNIGFPVRVDGVFGYETDDAVRAFQASNGLTPDGVVGPATAQALRSDYRVAYRPANSCGRPSCGKTFYPPVSTYPPVSAGPVVRETLKYVVSIPSDNPERLYRVQRFAPGAFFATSRLGTYINAGSFTERDSAEARAAELRAFGLDAQVRYRDF
ncbi:MAG: peptidoglycan-binding domain-containing protein [Kovacikia sp.]